jgi:hypothetical protein
VKPRRASTAASTPVPQAASRTVPPGLIRCSKRAVAGRFIARPLASASSPNIQS